MQMQLCSESASCQYVVGKEAQRCEVYLSRWLCLLVSHFFDFVTNFRAVDRTPRQFFTIRLVAVAYRRLQTVVFVLTQKMCSLLTNHINTGNWMVTGGFDGTVTIYKSTIRFEDFEWTPYFWNRSHAAMITHCRWGMILFSVFDNERLTST